MSDIQVSNLWKTFAGNGRHAPLEALKGVSFVVESGEFVSILGPSGCGKTTLLFILAGFVEPSTGVISCGGETVKGPGPERTVIFQDYGLFPWLTVEENIAFGLKPREQDGKAIAEMVSRYVRMVGLEGFEHSYPHQISGGMKQRVAIARALAPEPRVLLMDEPFAALDALTRERMQDEILAVWERTGKSMVLVTHSIDEALYLSDRVLVMSGRPGTVRESIVIHGPGRRRPRARGSGGGLSGYRDRIEALLSTESALRGVNER